MNTSELRTFDISTLNTKKREYMNSTKRSEDVYTFNLYVREKRKELESKEWVVPRGITQTIHPYSMNEDLGLEGTNITLAATSKNPNTLCQRTKEEVNAIINKTYHVLNDAPPELSQHTEQLKIETKIFNESIAKRAFNIYQVGKDTYGEI